jgi:protease-4
VYEQFLTKVAEGRELQREKVHELGQGRVWSGAEATKLGLVDELGGLQAAARFAAEKAGLGSDYQMDLPAGPKSFAEQLMESLSEETKPRADAAVDRLWGEVQQQVELLRSLNDPTGVYARMPVEVTIH